MHALKDYREHIKFVCVPLPPTCEKRRRGKSNNYCKKFSILTVLEWFFFSQHFFSPWGTQKMKWQF